MKIPWKVGEAGFLVPTLPSAPTAAYKLPAVTVIRLVAYAPRLVVRLADGTEIETDRANVSRTRPEPPANQPPKPRLRPALPDGFTEAPLWA